MKRRGPRFLGGWLERHQDPVSFWLHMVGIPLTLVAVWSVGDQAWREDWSQWWLPVVLLVAGYGLQWLGHVIEGNDMGEVILIKKLLNRPYVAVSPRYRRMAD